MYKEKEETKSRKEKEKKDRKKAREQKQQTKLIEEENKKSKQLAKKERSTKKSTQKQSPPKHLRRASGEKFQQNLKRLMCNESPDSEDNEDFNDRCAVCKSKYPPLNESQACSSKVMDKWIQCDISTEWFHLICLS